MIIIKTKEEIAIMKQGGRILAEILKDVSKKIKEGMSTKDIEKLTDELISQKGAKPAFKGYNGFPSSICVSVNEEVVHGMPKADKILKNGDIVGLDLGILYQGLYTDSAITVGVGKISKQAKKLIKETRKALYLGIKQVKPGNYITDISRAVENHAHKHGFSVVHDLVGHGVGKQVHEDPKVPNFYTKSAEIKLEPGMTIAIEPMINIGRSYIEISKDGWTVITKDRELSAHFEHTVAVTEKGCEILTE